MQYIKYQISSGEIVAYGSSNTDAVPLVSEDGFLVIEGVGTSFENYIKDGKILFYTDEQQQRKFQQPPTPSYWSNEVFNWIPRA
jgi:hypothetical protein